MNKEFLKMQKLAGVITEAQYNQKKSLIENKIINADQALKNSEIQAAGEKLADNPTLLQKAIKDLEKLNINKATLEKIAQAYKNGKDISNTIDDETKNIVNKLDEIDSPEKYSTKQGLQGAALGGLTSGVVGGLLPTLTAGQDLSTPQTMIAAAISAVVLGIAGAIGGYKAAKKSAEDDYKYKALKLIKQFGSKEKAIQHVKDELEKRKQQLPQLGYSGEMEYTSTIQALNDLK